MGRWFCGDRPVGNLPFRTAIPHVVFTYPPGNKEGVSEFVVAPLRSRRWFATLGSEFDSARSSISFVRLIVAVSSSQNYCRADRIATVSASEVSKVPAFRGDSGGSEEVRMVAVEIARHRLPLLLAEAHPRSTRHVGSMGFLAG